MRCSIISGLGRSFLSGTVPVVRLCASRPQADLIGLPGSCWWRDGSPDNGSIPVTVISGARTGDGMNAATCAEAIAAHAHRAAQSPYGRHVVAEHSSHYVPATEPDLIVREIARMIPLVADWDG